MPPRVPEVEGKEKPSRLSAADTATERRSTLQLDDEMPAASELDQAEAAELEALHSSIPTAELPKAEPTAGSASVKHEAAEPLPLGDTKMESSAANGDITAAEMAKEDAGLANGSTCTPLYSKGSR